MRITLSDNLISAGKVVLLVFVAAAASSCETMEFDPASSCPICQEKAKHSHAETKMIPVPEDPPYTIRPGFN